ncbi:hypothetical protein MASR1M59_18670 [Melaminivora sp.]
MLRYLLALLAFIVLAPLVLLGLLMLLGPWGLLVGAALALVWFIRR